MTSQTALPVSVSFAASHHDHDHAAGPHNHAAGPSNHAEASDAPTGLATPYRITAGDRFQGVLDHVGDRDWIAIDLGQGDSLVADFYGARTAPISDPYLRLYDDHGHLLAFDDNSGSGLEASLYFVAPSSGIYYIEASAANDAETGGYVLETFATGLAADGSHDDLADYLTDGYWRGYGQSPHAFDVSGDHVISVNLTGLTAEGLQLARWALEAWEMVADLDFQETSGSADIRFDDNSPSAFSNSTRSGGTIIEASVTIGTDWLARHGTTIDSYSFQTYMHEIGHALGLGHQGHYNGIASYYSGASFGNDSWQLSLMSYFNQTDNVTTGASYAALATPMLVDILAIQKLYGAATGGITAGDTVWGDGSSLGNYLGALYRAAGDPALNRGGPLALTIFDEGGIDRLNLGSDGHDLNIDLRGAGISDTGGLVGNMVIARDTVIEQLVTGAGNDRIQGNLADNLIETGAGADTVHAGRGVDLVYGGGGNDTLVGAGGADQLHGGADDDRLVGNNGDDRLWGDDGDDRLVGGRGLDALYGGNDNDDLSGAGGADTLHGDAGNDRLRGNADSDRLEGGDGDDVLEGGVGDDLLQGDAGNDRLRGDSGGDLLLGGDGDDVLIGNAGADTLRGEAGNDLLRGGIGTDSFVFDGGHDTVLDFQNDIDTIVFDAALWGGDRLSSEQILEHATVVGRDLVFDFGADDSLTITGLHRDWLLQDDLALL